MRISLKGLLRQSAALLAGGSVGKGMSKSGFAECLADLAKHIDGLEGGTVTLSDLLDHYAIMLPEDQQLWLQAIEGKGVKSRGAYGTPLDCLGAILNRALYGDYSQDLKKYALDEITTIKEALKGYEAAAESNRALVRRLDVAMNGEGGAAKQASLCDIVAQFEKLCAGMVLPGNAFYYNNSNALGLVHFVGMNPYSGAIVVTNSECSDKHLRQVAHWEALDRRPERDINPPSKFNGYFLKENKNDTDMV